MPSSPDDPAFWQQRAAEARAATTQMSDQLSRTAMLALAARYQRVADRILNGGIFSGAGNPEKSRRQSP
jgi:hypothetical protein